MDFTIETKVLSYEGARQILAAAVARAEQMKVPECISVVDSGGHTGEQDRDVAIAALKALPGAKQFD